MPSCHPGIRNERSLFDFSILSATAIVAEQGADIGSGAAILAYVVTAILLVARRKHVKPTATAVPTGQRFRSAIN